STAGGRPMPILFHPQRGRVIPTEKGKAILRAWVESSANPAEHGARVLHIKSLHTPRGIGAKLLGFFWLDVPFRAAGAAVRAGFRPGATCPLCETLASEGQTPRGKASRGFTPEMAAEAPVLRELAERTKAAQGDPDKLREIWTELSPRLSPQTRRE